MNEVLLLNHIKLCKRNLKTKRIKCCALCPFEEEILSIFPELSKAFIDKRKYHKITRKVI